MSTNKPSIWSVLLKIVFGILQLHFEIHICALVKLKEATNALTAAASKKPPVGLMKGQVLHATYKAYLLICHFK